MTQCHTALFGRKDYQQLRILEQMNKDLWLGVDVVGMPIIREQDGLAMSSRNAYLSAEQRTQALSLSRALGEAEKSILEGETSCEQLQTSIRSHIEAQADTRIDYIELVDAQSLEPVEAIESPTLCAMAVYVGKTRLIDNRVFSPA